MSPIKDLSDSVRLPRLGKIHLGIKVRNAKGTEYPQKTDYFVLPKDHSDFEKLVAIFGEKPKELRILIPVEDAEQWATQYYKAYNQTYGLVCKGDGETALRLADSKTGELPQAKTSTVVGLKEIPCAGQECPDYQAKKCHEVMNLKFLIPEVPGLGVWQIDTGSKNSIININSCAKIIKRAFGRISLIPLKLTFEPTPVNNPEDGKKQTVYVLNLRTDVTLAQLADQAKEQAKMFMIEAPDLEAMADMQIEKDIDDLWGGIIKAGTDIPTDEKTEQPPTLETSSGSVGSVREAPGDKVNTTPSEKSVSKSQKEGQSSGMVGKIEQDWLLESINKLKWDILKYLKDNYQVQRGTKETLLDVVAKLSDEQQDSLVKEIEDRLQML